MSIRPEQPAGGVHLLAPGASDATIAALATPALLAELTHLPAGVASTSFEMLAVPAGGGTGNCASGSTGCLIHIVTGVARIRWGPGLREQLGAQAGDTLVVPPDETFQALNPAGDCPLQLLLFRESRE